jgi:hypothetical protein
MTAHFSRGAAFMPLQRGQVFGVREFRGERMLKRRERRAPGALRPFLDGILTTNQQLCH